MDHTSVENFLIRFFKGNQCPIISQKHGEITVQLTEEMDKKLMNRPFYWQYIASTGKKGEPKKITFLTDPKNTGDGEWIHFGSPLLDKMYASLEEMGKYIQLFEKIETTVNTMLHPWLLINVCIVYEGKQKKEELLSIGLNLIHGTMGTDMMEKLKKSDLSTNISDHCYTISPLIMPESGFLRIERYLDDYVRQVDQQWAGESIQLLQEEVLMIQHFYEKQEDKTEMEKELEETKKRLEPSITYEIVNGGIVYLTANR